MAQLDDCIDAVTAQANESAAGGRRLRLVVNDAGAGRSSGVS
jgi:hypothetical protein